jgi:hypothetical protein
MWCLAAPGLAGAAQTIVSLTFDDGKASQSQMRSVLAAHGMKGTFFVNSAAVGASYSMSWQDLHDLAADGNEIGGHTLDHVDLTTVSASEATRQICDDRQALIAQGFSPVDFAYPFGANNSSVKQIVQSCGYDSGRGVSGLWNDCSGCPYAETIPPPDRYGTRSAGSPVTSTTLAELQSWVTAAEQHGGGWVQMSFHQICDGCEQYSTSLSTITAFLDWLQPRSANGTVVRTVHQALTGVPPPPPSDTTPPTTTIACNGAACQAGAYSAAVSVSLAATDNSGGSGVASTHYTTDGSTPTLTSPTYTTPFQVSQTTTVNYRSWDLSNNPETSKTQTITITPAPPGTTIEKAAGRPATASSSENATYAPQYANDGTTSTRWSSLFQDNQWWQVDLGSSRAVSSATITFNQWAWPKTYTISTSLDGTSWTIVATETLTSYGTKTSTFTQTNARYVRITGLTRGTSAGTSIEEALIYGPTD